MAIMYAISPMISALLSAALSAAVLIIIQSERHAQDRHFWADVLPLAQSGEHQKGSKPPIWLYCGQQSCWHHSSGLQAHLQAAATANAKPQIPAASKQRNACSG
jgi:hypothetical protein